MEHSWIIQSLNLFGGVPTCDWIILQVGILGDLAQAWFAEEPDEAAVKKYQDEAENHSTLDFVMGIAPGRS